MCYGCKHLVDCPRVTNHQRRGKTWKEKSNCQERVHPEGTRPHPDTYNKEITLSAAVILLSPRRLMSAECDPRTRVCVVASIMFTRVERTASEAPSEEGQDKERHAKKEKGLLFIFQVACMDDVG